jgi:O-antigen/teichoic acid export membrane protein
VTNLRAAWASRRGHIRGASSFLASRGVNAILVLVQLALVGRLYGDVDASLFFVLWTVIWAASVGIRFGFDQLLPKHAAAANLSGSLDALAGYRRIVRRSLPAVAVLSLPLLIVVLPSIELAEALVSVPIVVAGAAGWAVVYLLSALVRAYGHPGLSGWIGGPIGIGFATCAVPIAHAVSGSWLALGLASSSALVLAGACAGGLSIRAVGWERTKAALFARPVGPPDRDTVSTGVVMGLAEVNLVLPVWIAGALGVSAIEVGALYAALRVAGAFSWIFTSVVAVMTPMIADALARDDYGRLRHLMWRSAAAGAGATVPVALVGALASAKLLGLVDASYQDYGYLLVTLIGARLLDAATGAVGEALILGHHARWELVNQTVSTGALIATALILEGAIGVEALALAAALSTIVANLMRVLEIRWLMSNSWHHEPAATAS